MPTEDFPMPLIEKYFFCFITAWALPTCDMLEVKFIEMLHPP